MPGHHDAAGGVDLQGAVRHLEVLADRGDPVADDEHVGAGQDGVGVVHGQHGAAAQHDGTARRSGASVLGHRIAPPRCGQVSGLRADGCPATVTAITRRRQEFLDSGLDDASKTASRRPRGRVSALTDMRRSVHGRGPDGRTLGPARRPAGRRLLPDPGRALRHDAAGRPRRRGDQGRGPAGRRHPHLVAPGARRRLDLLPGDQPQQALGRARPEGPRRPGRGPGAGPPRRRHDRELQARRAGPVRAGLRHRRRRQPADRLRLDQRLRHRPEGRGAARLRPDGAGDLRADEPHRRPRRRRRSGPASRSST